MDVSFHEEIPFYSSTSKELLPDCSAKESVPLVDSIPPPTYPDHQESMAVGGNESKAPEEDVATGKIQRPLQVYSRKRTRPLLSYIPSSSNALNPDPLSQSISDPHSGTPSVELDLPIALRKGKWSCSTRHPIQNLVSSNHLSPVYQTFVS